MSSVVVKKKHLAFISAPSNYAVRAFAKKHRITAGSWRDLEILSRADEQRKNTGLALVTRLKSRGHLKPKQIVVAAMRKLTLPRSGGTGCAACCTASAEKP